jgi:hypothetical protein
MHWTTIYWTCFGTGVGFAVLSLATTMFDMPWLRHQGFGRIHAGGHHVTHAGAQARTSLAAHPSGLHHGAAADARMPFVVPFLLGYASPLSLLIMLTFFGGAGLLAQWKGGAIATFGPIIAMIAAFFAGTGMNVIAHNIATGEEPLAATSHVGVIGTVSMPIREGGTGEVVYMLNDTRQCAGARSEDLVPIARGAEVVIVRYERGIAYVVPWDEIARSEVTHMYARETAALPSTPP